MEISVRIERNGSVGGVTAQARCFVASEHAFCSHQLAMELCVHAKRSRTKEMRTNL